MLANQGLRRHTLCALFSATAFLSQAVAGGIDRGAMDPKTSPGSDFWTYANGAWVKAHPIPADRSSYGIDAMLTEEANKRTADLIESAAKNAKPGSEAQK